MQRSLYQVLEIPSSSTRDEIRAAYRRQLARIRVGDLSPSLRQQIERACVTLDDPDRRIRYDIAFARHSRFYRVKREVGSRTQSQFMTNLITSGGALLAAAAIILLAGSFMHGGRRAAPMQARPGADTAQPTPTIVAMPLAVADAPPLGEAAPSAPQDAASQVAASPVASPPDANPPAPAAAAPVTAAPAPPVVEARSALTAEPAVPPFAAAPLDGGGAVAVDQPAPAGPAPAVAPDTSSAPTLIGGGDPPAAAPSLVESSPFGRVQPNGARADSHVQGWFCHDASGGEVFIPVGAPLPAGVTCQ
jgi:hypothetical protein